MGLENISFDLAQIFFSLANNYGEIYEMLYNRIEWSNFFSKQHRKMSTLHGLQSSTEIVFYKITFIEFYEYPLYTLHRIWHAFKAERKENRYGYQKSLSFWPLNKNNNEKDETTQIIVSDISMYTYIKRTE